LERENASLTIQLRDAHERCLDLQMALEETVNDVVSRDPQEEMPRENESSEDLLQRVSASFVFIA